MTTFSSNPLTTTYLVKYPFVGAGMAFAASTPDLAIAVCKAGGIGSIAAGPFPPQAIRFLIREVRKATQKALNVNFITFLTSDEQLQVCIEEKVPIVSFHWGLPSKEIVSRLHEAGIKVWQQVGSVTDAKEAVQNGADLIIAQGLEAGGHNFSTLPTFVLVPQIVEAVKAVPVLAAGGITTGKQVAAALCLGAAGVWVGTRLLASPEAFIHPHYKTLLVEKSGEDTCLTSIFGPDMAHFNPMRVLHNKVTQEFEGKNTQNLSTAADRETIVGKTSMFGQKMELKRFTSFVPMPTTEGDLEEMPLLAGQGVGLIHNIMPAEEIVITMMEEAMQTLSSFHEQDA